MIEQANEFLGWLWLLGMLFSMIFFPASLLGIFASIYGMIENAKSERQDDEFEDESGPLTGALLFSLMTGAFLYHNFVQEIDIDMPDLPGYVVFSPVLFFFSFSILLECLIFKISHSAHKPAIPWWLGVLFLLLAIAILGVAWVFASNERDGASETTGLSVDGRRGRSTRLISETASGQLRVFMPAMKRYHVYYEGVVAWRAREG